MEAGGDFSIRLLLHVPGHITRKCGVNILEINCFIALVLKNSHMG